MKNEKQFNNLIQLGFVHENKTVVKGSRRIVRNLCKCRRCGDVIESKGTHDFVSCSCGSIFTDGGLDYIRHGFTDPNDLIDLSQFEN